MKVTAKLLAFLLITAPVATQAADTVTLIGGEFNEDLRSASEISGAFVLGIAGIGAVSEIRPSLNVYMPSDWSGRLFCVRMISVDGLYVALNTYRLNPEWTGGNVTIPFPSEHAEYLKRWLPEDMAVRTRLGACDGEKGDDTVAYWNVEPDGAAISILVNSFRADKVYFYAGDDPAAEPILCRRSEATAQAAFDTVCPVPEGALAGSDMVTLELYRIRNRQRDPPIFVTLRILPAAQ